jgi:hypothetical protein
MGASISRLATPFIMSGTMALAAANQHHALKCLENQFTPTEKAQDLFNSRTWRIAELLLPAKGSILGGAGLFATGQYLQSLPGSDADRVFLKSVQKTGRKMFTQGILRGTERVIDRATQKWGELPGFKEAAVYRFLMNAKPAEKPFSIYSPSLYEQHMFVD